MVSIRFHNTASAIGELGGGEPDMSTVCLVYPMNTPVYLASVYAP